MPLTCRKLTIVENKNQNLKNLLCSHENIIWLPSCLVTKPPKWHKENWRFCNFKIQKQKTLKIHMKKYHVSSLVKTSHKKIEHPQNDKKEIEIFKTSKYQIKWIFFFSSQWNQFMWEIKFSNRSSPFRWNVFSQLVEVKSLKWSFFMSSGVTLITFFSLLMVGHFTPMGINSSDHFSSPMGALQGILFFHHQWGVTSSEFFFRH